MRENYGTAADYFAIGVVCHELMKGYKPYISEDRDSYKQKICKRQYALNKADTPENWGHEASDFINKCIRRKTE